MPQRTYVLVHGAWHGGWCWVRVAPLLRDAGQRVFTPTLTGMAERRGELSASITLDTHIADIVRLFETENLHDVVLVGHSYAGLIITAVADHFAGTDRIRQLVYLDAFLPVDGQCWSSFHTPEARLKHIEEAMTLGHGIGIPPPDAAAFGDTDPADLIWIEQHITPQPLGVYDSPIHLKNGGGADLPRTFIDCTHPPAPTLVSTKLRVKPDSTWNYIELPTGHDAMLTMPRELTDILLTKV